MELQGFMERQKIPSYFLNVTKRTFESAYEKFKGEAEEGGYDCQGNRVCVDSR